VVGGVCRRNRVPGSSGSGDRSQVFGLPRRRVSGHGCLHRNPRLDFSVGPGSGYRNRLSWSGVAGVTGEKRQHALRAVCRPASQRGVVGGFQRAASVNGYESSISHQALSWWLARGLSIPPTRMQD
jgi:hypothetical protein